MKTFLRLSALCLTLGAATLPAHEHLAVGKDAAGRLQLYSGSGAALTNPTISTVYHLCPRPVGQTLGGYYTLSDEDPRVPYPNDSFAFIAYSDGQVQADGPNHAATGANIWCEVTNVTGPAGAHLGIWDENWEYNHTTPTVSFTANAPTGGWKFAVGEPLSQPDAPAGAVPVRESDLPSAGPLYVIPGSVAVMKVDPGEDPYGHIHNRGFTVDKPGNYVVGFTFHDLGGNGAGGGPRNAASPTYYFHFQAGPAFTPTPALSGPNVVLTWGSLMGVGNGQNGVVFTVQRSLDLTNPSGWVTLGSVTGTTAAAATFTDPGRASLGRAFYRLQYSWSTPP